jgi:uncharacterized protein (TIGR03118 family)
MSVVAAPALAEGDRNGGRSYVQTNLVSDIPGLAAHTDANLHNPWGTSTGPGLPIWVSDNATGVATLYDGQGNLKEVAPNQPSVAMPAPPSAGPGAAGAPTGTTFNPTPDGFVVSKGGVSGPSKFLFATEDGTLVGWNPSVDVKSGVIAVDRSQATDTEGDHAAVYKGLALVTTPAGKFLYATNFRFGQVEVFDSSFNIVNIFTDPTVPAGFAPFGIHNIGGNLFVTFAKQDAFKHDDVAGAGNGFVDVFSPNGVRLQRFASHGKLDSPWAVTLAPSTFGAFGADILVGNFGSGHINAYDATSGGFRGQLRNTDGDPLTISGLWGLRFPTTSLNVTDPNALYFTAGLNHEADGLFGTLTPNPEKDKDK